ncbi:HAD-IA family hydrolase [Emticicia sp. CRIBPO]|uniref:HAD family hydrolase n=1 Tax=Emticicia sp. CRIBPO TaxID=2683258 RepID=UPI0014129727|nr:HAD family phosphatase [Emticicia sp. CRIBPO]NBA85909.1 HAD-IA family hydrolase [Emticicia sp. CRIBPO]
MNKYAVIFDMDGVICHTNPYHTIAFERFFEKRGLNPTHEEYAEHMFGKSNSYILSHFLKRKVEGEEFLALEFEKEALFREIYADHISPIDDFPAFLDSLKTAGLKTGVATSAPRANLDLIMNFLKFEPKMESIMASENVTKHKPDPQVYLKSAENLGVDPANCMVFEDSVSGITAGLNAGMRVIGVLSSHKKEELPPCHLYIDNYLHLTSQTILDILINEK